MSFGALSLLCICTECRLLKPHYCFHLYIKENCSWSHLFGNSSLITYYWIGLFMNNSQYGLSIILTLVTMISIFYSSSIKIKPITLRTQIEERKCEFWHLLSKVGKSHLTLEITRISVKITELRKGIEGQLWRIKKGLQWKKKMELLAHIRHRYTIKHTYRRAMVKKKTKKELYLFPISNSRLFEYLLSAFSVSII